MTFFVGSVTLYLTGVETGGSDGSLIRVGESPDPRPRPGPDSTHTVVVFRGRDRVTGAPVPRGTQSSVTEVWLGASPFSAQRHRSRPSAMSRPRLTF